MGVSEYIGARYVPQFAEPSEWNDVRTYEPLTIVLHKGNSYTSKQFVPRGVALTDSKYWAETGNFNAQVEGYREETLRLSDKRSFAFDTVTDMQAANNLQVGDICHTNGFYNPGDNGDAWYKVVTNKNVNNIDILYISAELQAEYIYQNKNNLECFGIKPDTDCTDILSYLINKEIYLIGNGKYLIESLDISSKELNIELNNLVASTINFVDCTGNFDVNLEQKALISANLITFSDCDQLNIRGSVKNCSRQAYVINQCNNIDISVNVSNSGLSGIYVTCTNKNCQNIFIHDCIMDKTGQLEGSYNNAIYVNSYQDSYYPTNVVINSCVLTDCGCGGVFIAGDNCSIDNVNIINTGLVTPATSHAIRIHDSKYNNISNCHIVKAGRSGIEVSKASYVVIVNCQIELSTGAGVSLNYDATAAGRYQGEDANNNVTICNCSLLNNNTGNSGNAGINATRYTNVTILGVVVNTTGNNVKHSRGILLSQEIPSMTIIGCVFMNAQSNTGVNYQTGLSLYVDGNGAHLGLNGKYQSALPNYHLPSTTTSSLTESSDTQAIVRFLSSLVLSLSNYGFINRITD